MSGATIDYELRPAKNVDRRVFVDLLARSERHMTLEGASYTSMGGYPMTDHRMIHRRLGIENLVSIDGNSDVVSRQNFNKPTEKCVCLNMFSNDLIDNLDNVFEDQAIDLQARKVIWLDYTSPCSLADQLNEFESLLRKVAVHDIIRITLNANNDALKYSVKEGADQEEIRQARFKKLEDMVGAYLPHGSSDDNISKSNFPVLLAKILGIAARKALPANGSHTFLPLSTVSYKDGQRMLTMTGIVIEKQNVDNFLNLTNFKSWPFFSEKFEDVKFLTVAVLTMKERMLMERLAVSSKNENIEDHLKFKKFGNLKATDYFEDFKKHARFYPTHAQLDL